MKVKIENHFVRVILPIFLGSLVLSACKTAPKPVFRPSLEEQLSKENILSSEEGLVDGESVVDIERLNSDQELLTLHALSEQEEIVKESEPFLSKDIAKQAQVPASYLKEDSVYHEVSEQETLYSIAKRYGSTPFDIARLNNINDITQIKVGAVLLIKEAVYAEKKEDPSTGSAGKENTQVLAPELSEPINHEDVSTISQPIGGILSYSDDNWRKEHSQTNQAVAINDNKEDSQRTGDQVSEVNLISSGKTKKNHGITWQWPIQGVVTKTLKEDGQSDLKGIEILAKTQKVFSSADGEVIYAGQDIPAYGKMIIVKHSPKWFSVYANNGKLLVKEGQNITRGSHISDLKTDKKQAKLYFEIRQNGVSINPMTVLP